jgi:hypothetical protein
MNIDFEITQNGHTLRDALVLPDNHGLSKTQITQMQQARFDAWYLVVTTPVENPNPEEPPED